MQGQSFKPIFRSLLYCKQFQDAKHFKVWMWCLLKATDNPVDAPVGDQIIPLKPGQFIYGVLRASDALNMTQATVRNCMNWLKKDGCIDIEPKNKFSIVTITNDAKYRKFLSDMKNKKITNQEQIKTYNNDNKEKDIYTDSFLRFWTVYPKRLSKRSAFESWKLISPSEELTKTIIEQVIACSHSNGWKKDEGKYIPYPAKWLQESRWEDEVVDDRKPRNYAIGGDIEGIKY